MEPHTKESCARSRRAIQDTLEVVSGKWKLLILITLKNGPFRFKELTRELGITPRMLSRELQELEANQLVSRTVESTRPISVTYAITDYGETFNEVLNALQNWGAKHRKQIMTSAD